MNNLTKKQSLAIDELFETSGDETAVLQKYNISRKDWRKWLADKDFADEIAVRLEASKRQSRIILSKYVSIAAAKLVELCGSENQETSRKACLDILDLQKNPQSVSQQEDSLPQPAISPETASKLLAALADKAD